MNAVVPPLTFFQPMNWHVLALMHWERIAIYGLKTLAILLIWIALGGLLALLLFSRRGRDDD